MLRQAMEDMLYVEFGDLSDAEQDIEMEFWSEE